MHNSMFENDANHTECAEVLLAIVALIVEGRKQTNCPKTKCRGIYDLDSKCTINKAIRKQPCDFIFYEKIRSEVLLWYQKSIPLCVSVYLATKCPCYQDTTIIDNNSEHLDDCVLLEQWYLNVCPKRSLETSPFSTEQVMSAIRSQLHFSQLSAWHLSDDDAVRTSLSTKTVVYSISGPDESVRLFRLSASEHHFPPADLGPVAGSGSLKVSLLSLPRGDVPQVQCPRCEAVGGGGGANTEPRKRKVLLDDRMYTLCTLKGKHRCEEPEDVEMEPTNGFFRHVGRCRGRSEPFCDRAGKQHDLTTIAAAAAANTNTSTTRRQNSDTRICDSDGGTSAGGDCDNAGAGIRDISNVFSLKFLKQRQKVKVKQRITFDDDDDEEDADDGLAKAGFKKKELLLLPPKEAQQQQQQQLQEQQPPAPPSPPPQLQQQPKSGIPTALEQAKFRRSLDSAASMVFHSRTGLPLTSSPAPMRKGKSSFDFDSSLNSVSAIRSALFSLVSPTDEDSESDCSLVSPCSPEIVEQLKKRGPSAIKLYQRRQPASLLGTFEESVLNGRLEPVSTVHGFTAELGASGLFCPRHKKLPVTVFFYTLGDNDKVSTPYLGHINLGKKGYPVPRTGTVQLTLFNPLGTVVKMFVVMYDLMDMPPNSQTFIRQRTLYMPADWVGDELKHSGGEKWLRYLIHLRFMSSKSGRVYLHSDIRVIIFHKSDLDTATGHGLDQSYELRSFTHSPNDPKFSPRK